MAPAAMASIRSQTTTFTGAPRRRAFPAATAAAAGEMSVAHASAPVSSCSVTASAPEPVPTSSTRAAPRRRLEGDFHHVLGLRARNQHVGRHAELAAVELLPPGDVLRGFAVETLVQVAAVVQPLHLLQFPLGMGVEVDALLANGVRQQHLGGEPRHRDAGILQQASALEQRRVHRH